MDGSISAIGNTEEQLLCPYCALDISLETSAELRQRFRASALSLTLPSNYGCAHGHS